MSHTQALLLSPYHTSQKKDENLNNLPVSTTVPRPGPSSGDLPSWTPLKGTPNEEGLSASEPEVDELSIPTTKESQGAGLVKRRGGPLIKPSSTALGDGPTDEQTLKSPSDMILSTGNLKRKRARFEGVVILTKPPPDWKRIQPRSARAQSLSLLAALTRTFDANKHTETLGRSHHAPASRRRDDTSTPTHTDVETTEAEDEHLQLNTRLAHASSSLKNRLVYTRATAHASESNSEDAVSAHHERPIKRIKPIVYESNLASIDAALGTVQAPISWDAELDLITRDDDIMGLVQTQMVQAAQAASVDDRMAVDEGAHAGHAENTGPVVVPLPARKTLRMPPHGPLRTPVLSPYLSRGAGFRQRLAATFGEDATVRTDRVARPRVVDLDDYMMLDDNDRAPSPSLSESSGSVSSVSAAAKAASAFPSTHVTSQSPDRSLPAPMDAGRIDHLLTDTDNLFDDAGPVTEPRPADGNEEQLDSWIAALQRLVKGKVRVKEEDLEALSIIIAEIESVKDNLDATALTLHESIRQLSELYEIPFGDRNKLRQRAERILHTWSAMGKPGAS